VCFSRRGECVLLFSLSGPALAHSLARECVSKSFVCRRNSSSDSTSYISTMKNLRKGAFPCDENARQHTNAAIVSPPQLDTETFISAISCSNTKEP
jgi:hypothetical protein